MIRKRLQKKKSYINSSLVYNCPSHMVLFMFFRTARQVKPNKKYGDDEAVDGPKRPCNRAGCPDKAPICFAGVSER